MGAVEETRRQMSGSGRVVRDRRPDPAVEAVLRRDVERAERNLARYLARARVDDEGTKSVAFQ